MIHLEIRQINQDLEKFCRKAMRPFKTNDDILEITLKIFKLRCCLSSDHIKQDNSNLKNGNSRIISKATKALHKCINITPPVISLMSLFQKYKLNRLEKEIVLFMILHHFQMLDEMRNSCGIIEVIQQYLNNGSFKEAVRIKKTLSNSGKLFTSDILIPDGDDPDEFFISNNIISTILDKKKAFESGWDITTYKDLLDRTFDCIKLARKQLSNIERCYRQSTDERDSMYCIQRIRILLDRFKRTLSKHPGWELNLLMKSNLSLREMFIILVLLAKDLAMCSPHDELFTGMGLARCVSRDVPSVQENLLLLTHDHPLRKEGYIRIGGGQSSNPALEDESTLQSCEFEITTEYLKKLNINRKRKSGNTARQPVVKLSQLVLSERAMSSIQLSLNHILNHKILFDKWGLGKTICYGRGVTILFSGPSGTGKTACAEAIAEKLDKQIIVINYAEMQSCWVGQTEKNIVRAFREAADADAVLFWDEADAMFYDRDSAAQNWEVRDVNVLLQELEHYEGICILSTNRKTQLDKALERRLSMKIDFEPPTKEMRQKIWQKLIPQEMPLATDVDFEELSGERLTGGEIKNVILNSARIALKRNPRTKVCKSDFVEAISMEKQGSWSRNHERFGFRSKSEAG